MNLRTRQCVEQLVFLLFVANQRLDVILLKYFPAWQKSQLNQECQTTNAASELFYQSRGCGGRSARRKEIVHDQHLLAWFNGIGVYLNRVGPVFQVILLAYAVMWKFSELSDRCETHTHGQGNWHSKYK